jgi:hypothetical protein
MYPVCMLDRKGLAGFLAIAFGIAWLLAVPLWLDPRHLAAPWTKWVLMATMFAPAIATFVVARWISVSTAPRRETGLVLGRRWVRFWVFADLGMLLFVVGALGRVARASRRARVQLSATPRSRAASHDRLLRDLRDPARLERVALAARVHRLARDDAQVAGRDGLTGQRAAAACCSVFFGFGLASSIAFRCAMCSSIQMVIGLAMYQVE